MPFLLGMTVEQLAYVRGRLARLHFAHVGLCGKQAVCCSWRRLLPTRMAAVAEYLHSFGGRRDVLCKTT